MKSNIVPSIILAASLLGASYMLSSAIRDHARILATSEGATKQLQVEVANSPLSAFKVEVAHGQK